MKFTIPTPPSTNGLYTNVKGRGRVKTDRYNVWLNAAGWDVNKQKPKPIAGDVSVVIEVPRNKRRDIDNHAKATLDLCVKHRLIDDDKYVTNLTIKYADRKDVLVTITPDKSKAINAAGMQ